MILNRAPRQFSARTGARVLAPLVDASRGVEAVGVTGALWPAVRRASDEIEQAGAGWLRSDHLALGIRAARAGRARIARVLERWLRNVVPGALHQRIAGVAVGAGANGVVVDRQALGVHSAGARARIRALVLYAGLVLGALGADDALWPTGGRYSDESRLAEAHSVAVVDAAVAVGSAGRRLARVNGHRRRCHLYFRAQVDRIPCVAWQATARWSVVHHATRCALAAGPGAGVDALVVQAGLGTIAVRVRHTLGPATCVRVTDVLWHAGAGAHAVPLVADCVRAAGRRVARGSRLLSGSRF